MNLSETIDEIQKRLTAASGTVIGSNTYRQPIDRIKAKDGFSVSVQAGRFLYSHPRQDQGPWSAVELGFPNRRIPALAEYADGKYHTKTIFPFVPIEKVAQVFLDHGGIV